MCRLAMYVATSNRSEITLEAWLPTGWTGRFLSTRNGGVSGCIQYPDLAYTAGLGFATVGANNGHNGTRGPVSQVYFKLHSELRLTYHRPSPTTPTS
jgi:feruloyl esterase